MFSYLNLLNDKIIKINDNEYFVQGKYFNILASIDSDIEILNIKWTYLDGSRGGLLEVISIHNDMNIEEFIRFRLKNGIFKIINIIAFDCNFAISTKENLEATLQLINNLKNTNDYKIINILSRHIDLYSFDFCSPEEIYIEKYIHKNLIIESNENDIFSDLYSYLA